MPNAGFNCCIIDFRPSLYFADMEFPFSLHSPVLSFLRAGQHPTGPVPRSTNFRAPRLFILCQRKKKKGECIC